ncbi:TetR/AcrR family transcriptional regulator [Paenibacillus lignilyticus]|uniref:TetR/AcrR family transcriptional regulator n=1 Tax=Paenibacillus lignilyticus TaxID=1172615 RepID=A0ABS5CJJ1_9BACL|nr:TetR/AcrR family transcriptional regulator [Paenibacillus lignilyticus]MBP3966029.1 TetR/AcrR family transcriptional regulator [Paenibacillus lignilyticus]
MSDTKDHYDDEAIQSLPESVKLSWGIIKPSRRGPKGELSIPKIVDTAVAIADQDGLSAVSMSRVAGALGFTTMSLYRYITSKEDLLLLMQDRVCPPPPEAEPDSGTGASKKHWRAEMQDYVQFCIKVFRDHPWFADIPIRSVPMMPGNLRIIDWMLRIMRGFPVNDFEKMSFVLLISSYARACGMIARDMDLVIKAGDSFSTFSGLSYTAALKQLITESNFPDLQPIVMSGAYTGEVESPIGDDLAFGLERILDGIEQYLEVRRQM